jgi:hypothetical protein
MNKMPEITDNNTRKFHRSSILAFPQHTDYACAVEVHRSYKMPWIVKFSIWILVILYALHVGVQLFPWFVQILKGVLYV